MGKTFRRDQANRPKKGGKIFNKDKPWKKGKHRSPKDNQQSTGSFEDIIDYT